ncbi:MAG: single-stranded DNA-binding protein [Desulfobacter sp.]
MFHQTIVVGRVGKDPEVRYTTSGQAAANLSLAVTEKYKEKETTTWYRVQLWGRLAELAGEHVTKGMMLLIEGRMNTREYEKDGVKRESWELIANVMKFLSSK